MILKKIEVNSPDDERVASDEYLHWLYLFIFTRLKGQFSRMLTISIMTKSR